MNILFFVSFLLLLLYSFQVVCAVPYDYSYTSECLESPLPPQYKGGIVLNPELNEGLKGWSVFGDARIEHVESSNGNKYIVSGGRQQPFHSLSQEFNLEKGKLYTFSVWLQLSQGEGDVGANFNSKGGFMTAGWVTARSGCWTMLKGGFVANFSGPALLYLESKNISVDIHADSFSLQPFSEKEWRLHQKSNVQKFRKRRVRFQVLDKQGRSVPNATVSMKQARPGFKFGCAINQNIINNPAYQAWFFPRFKYTAIENELKWHYTEKTRGVEDYSAADALTKLAASRGVSIRGHNVFWDDPRYQPSWLRNLSPAELSAATDKRINSVMNRYRGRFFHWDVLNENLHFNFFESRLGNAVDSRFYQAANRIDGQTTPFLNDYNTIEDRRDTAVSPDKYLQKIQELRRGGYNGPLGIGVEGHFSVAPDPAYIRSSIDHLASAKLPIWITELDFASNLNQAAYLDQVLRELYAHPSIEGIIIWSGWNPGGCYRMCLTDNSFKNLATGNVVDKFRISSGFTRKFMATTDSNGFLNAMLFTGEYEVNASHSNGVWSSKLHKFDVASNKEVQGLIQFKLEV